jgi:hypothetical protein
MVGFPLGKYGKKWEHQKITLNKAMSLIGHSPGTVIRVKPPLVPLTPRRITGTAVESSVAWVLHGFSMGKTAFPL